MGKIHETLSLIKAGARNNKYRIIYPILGKNFDILANAATFPGVEMGSAEVYYRGRKVQLPGDRIEDHKWEATIYNTPDLFIRKFFMILMEAKQNYYTKTEFLDRLKFLQDLGVKEGLKEIFDIINNLSTDLSFFTDIIVQQLDHNENPTSIVILEDAFISSISPIEYIDTSGDISTSNITFSYNNLKYIL